MKKKIFIVAFVLILLSCLVGFTFAFKKSEEKIAEEKEDISQYEYITTKFSSVSVQDEQSAKEALKDVRSAIGVINPEQEVELKSMHTVDNATYYRFNQVYKGLEVYHKEIILNSIDGVPTNLVYNTISIDPDFVTTFTHSIEDVKKELEKKMQNSIVITNYEEIIYDADPYVLAYLVDFESNNINYQYIVTDQLDIIEISAILNTTYQGYNGLNSKIELSNGLYLKDRKIGIYETEVLSFFSQTLSYPKTGVATLKKTVYPNKKEVTALDYIAKTYDYYGKMFNHYSFDGEGKSDIKLFIDVNNIEVNNTKQSLQNNAVYFSNANYDKEMIAIGKCGFNCESIYQLEVLAHEYTHGVFNHIVTATNDEEASALTEAYADIFGLLIKNYYYGGEFDWNISNFRDLSNLGSDFVTNYQEPLVEDSHKNSTIFSTAFYKIYTGEDAKNKRSRVNNTKVLANLYYNSLFLLPVEGGFKEAEYAVILSAQKLYNEKQLTYGQLGYIKASFDNVGLPASVLDFSKENTTKDYYYVRDNFKITGMNLKGENLERYHLKIEQYDNDTDQLLKTIVDEDVSNTYETNLERTATNKTNIDSYYKITISKDDKTTSILAVQVDNLYTKRDRIQLFLNVNAKVEENVSSDVPVQGDNFYQEEIPSSKDPLEPTIPSYEVPTIDSNNNANVGKTVTMYFDKNGLDVELSFDSASCTIGVYGYCYVNFPTVNGEQATWCPKGSLDACIVGRDSQPARVGISKDDTWSVDKIWYENQNR